MCVRDCSVLRQDTEKNGRGWREGKRALHYTTQISRHSMKKEEQTAGGWGEEDGARDRRVGTGDSLVPERIFCRGLSSSVQQHRYRCQYRHLLYLYLSPSLARFQLLHVILFFLSLEKISSKLCIQLYPCPLPIRG